MDNPCNPPQFFARVSPRVAGALAAQLGGGEATSGAPGERVGAAALDAAWRELSQAARLGYGPAFARLQSLSVRAARPYLLAEARASWGDTFPAVLRLLDAISTPDLAVRMYLESASAVERAYFELATRLLSQISVYQGRYVADVIPSLDRRGRMRRAMEAARGPRADAPTQVSEFVTDTRFLIALHHGARLSAERSFDGGQQPDPDLGRPEVEVLVEFRFDASRLVVKAPTAEQRQRLRDAFIHTFVGDPHYFEPPGERRPRYSLTVSGGGLRSLESNVPRPTRRTLTTASLAADRE